jgi:hypothetical protein
MRVRTSGPVLAGRLLLAAIGIAIGVGGVLALREATLSTHQPVGADSKAIVLMEAHSRNAEKGQTLYEMVDALVHACRLQVGRSDVYRLTQLDEHRFEAELRRGLDQTNRRQLRGCLEDWTLDYVRVDVVSLTTID